MARGAVGDDSAFRQAADFYLVRFRLVIVDKRRRDRADLDRSVFQAVVINVAGVITFSVDHMSIVKHRPGGFQRFQAGIGLHAAAAQRHRRAVVDRDIDVVVARAGLVVVIDVEGVITRLCRREGGCVDPGALAPGLGRHQLAADGNRQAVIGAAGEAVALAGFQVNQTGDFGRGEFHHISVAHVGGHTRGGCAVRRLSVDDPDQIAGLNNPIAVRTQCTRQVAAGPGLNGQAGWHVTECADGHDRNVRHWVDIHGDGFRIAVELAVGRLELQLGVITLLVTDAGVAEAVIARLVGRWAVTHIVIVEVGLAEGLARRRIGFQISRAELDPDTVDFVLDGTVGQAGEDDFQVRGIHIVDPERRPFQLDWGVFVAFYIAIARSRRVVDRSYGDGAVGRR